MEYETLKYIGFSSGQHRTSTVELRPFYQTELKESLEKIIFKEEPEKEGGIVSRIFSDKGKTLKSTIKALFNEMQLREKLDSQMTYKIDEDISKQRLDLEHLSSLRVHYSPELAKDVGKQKEQLQSSILELEREKRKEYVECWRDLSFMKKYLLGALKDYWDLGRKRNVLGRDFNDLINNENNKGYRGSM